MVEVSVAVAVDDRSEQMMEKLNLLVALGRIVLPVVLQTKLTMRPLALVPNLVLMDKIIAFLWKVMEKQPLGLVMKSLMKDRIHASHGPMKKFCQMKLQ